MKAAQRFDEIMLTCGAFDYGIKSVPGPLLVITEFKMQL